MPKSAPKSQNEDHRLSLSLSLLMHYSCAFYFLCLSLSISPSAPLFFYYSFLFFSSLSLSLLPLRCMLAAHLNSSFPPSIIHRTTSASLLEYCISVDKSPLASFQERLSRNVRTTRADSHQFPHPHTLAP